MDNFTIDNNGIIINEVNDAIFVPNTYLPNFRLMLEDALDYKLNGLTRTVGFLSCSFLHDGVAVADGHEGVHISREEIKQILAETATCQ